MPTEDDSNQQLLVPPAVTALRYEDAATRVPIHRTESMNIRDEREDLKQAAEQSLNVILDLGLDGIIQWVSPSWKDVVGTFAEEIKGTPIAHLLLGDKNAFADAVESMKKDDSRSQIIRFQVRMGASLYRATKAAGDQLRLQQDQGIREEPRAEEGQEDEKEEAQEGDKIISLEGQGIMVYDRSGAGESHVGSLHRALLKAHWIWLTNRTDHVDDQTGPKATRNHH